MNNQMNNPHCPDYAKTPLAFAVEELTLAKEEMAKARELADAARKLLSFLEKAEKMTLERVEALVAEIRRAA